MVMRNPGQSDSCVRGCPKGDLRTNHPPHAPQRGLIVHHPAADCTGKELGFQCAARYVILCVTM